MGGSLTAFFACLAAFGLSGSQDPVQKGKVYWATDYDRALAEAKNSGKLVLLYFWQKS